MEFEPNPKISLEKNLELFEEKIKKEQWYKNIAIGIFAPLYPIFWLIDQPKKKKALKEGKEEIRKKFSTPLYFAKWEIKAVNEHLKAIEKKIKELHDIEEELDASSHQLIEMDLANHGHELWEGKKQEVIEKIEVQKGRKRVFQKYLDNLNRIKTLQKTDQKLKKITADEEKKLISMLIYEQNMKDQHAKIRFLSEEMGASEDLKNLEDRIEKLEEFHSRISESSPENT